MRVIQSVVLVGCLTVFLVFVSATAKAPTDSPNAISLETIAAIVAASVAVVAALAGGIVWVVRACNKVTDRITSLETQAKQNGEMLAKLSPKVDDLAHIQGILESQTQDNRETLGRLTSTVNSLDRAQGTLQSQMEHHEKAIKAVEDRLYIQESTLLEDEGHLRRKGVLSSGQEAVPQGEYWRPTSQEERARLAAHLAGLLPEKNRDLKSHAEKENQGDQSTSIASRRKQQQEKRKKSKKT